MNNKLYIAISNLAGPNFTAVFSTVLLWLALAFGSSQELSYFILFSYFLSRFIYDKFLAQVSVFNNDLINNKFSKLFKREILIAIIFLSFCYMANLKVERTLFAAFITANFFIQLVINELVVRLSCNRENLSNSNKKHQVIILGSGPQAKRTADFILDNQALGSNLIGFIDYDSDKLWSYRDIPLIGHPDEMKRLISELHLNLLIFAAEPQDIHKTRSLFALTEKMGVPICTLPVLYETRISQPQTVNLNGFTVQLYTATPSNRASLFIKSAIDKVGALVVIALVSPIMMLTALAIKIESEGPVFFKQKRSGLNGKKFNFIKFRSMCNNAEKQKENLLNKNEMSGPVFKIKNDPRITRVGKFIRKYSIDELPQLFNVLKGEMSLVGPRPPIPEEVINYEAWQHRKLSIKPGITCKWQVEGRNNIDFEDWMKLDLEYIDNWSLWEDGKILAKTLPAVLKGDGAS